MSLGLSESLSKIVRSKYNAAVAAEALTFAATQLRVVKISDISYQVRFSPALAKKPTPTTDKQHEKEGPKKSDPFENPDHELLVASIPVTDPSHTLILNKFPIIKNHFILATQTNKEQTHFLEEDDLWLTYRCLREWQTDADRDSNTNRLFAFFNSGPHSGASQPHRHLQLMPVDDMKEDQSGGFEWSLLTDSILDAPDHSEPGKLSFFKSCKDIPFRHFAARLAPEPSSSHIHHTYLNLYQSCLDVVREYISSNPDEDFELHSEEDGNLPISYNLALTTDAMVVCPRRKEGGMIKRADGTNVDVAALNGTMLAGTLLTKNEEVWELLSTDASRLKDVLAGVGIPAGNATRNLNVNL